MITQSVYCKLTRNDVGIVNNNVGVPVRSCVFMPEPQGVHQFVVDRPRPHSTARPQRHFLFPTLSPDRTITPVVKSLNDIVEITIDM